MALLAGLAMIVTSAAIFAGAAQATGGDNGTVKTHKVGTPTDDVNDEPKVGCQFYLDAFFFDNTQSVNWWIVEGTHGATVAHGDIALDQDGHGYTDAISGLEAGQYKLYWTFEGQNGAAKHKEFKIEGDCTPPGDHSVTPASPTATQLSCDNPVETVTPSNQDGVIWSPSGSTNLNPGQSVTYTASPAEGYTFPEDAQTSFPFSNTFDTTKCTPPGDHSVTPAAPTATQPSCTNTVMTVTPSNQEGVIWSPAGVSHLNPGQSVTYTASADKGYAFPKDAQKSWTFSNTFDTTKCGSTTPPTCPPGWTYSNGVCIQQLTPGHHPKPKHHPKNNATPTVVGPQLGTGSGGPTALSSVSQDNQSSSLLVAFGLLVFGIGIASAGGAGLVRNSRRSEARK